MIQKWKVNCSLPIGGRSIRLDVFTVLLLEGCSDISCIKQQCLLLCLATHPRQNRHSSPPERLMDRLLLPWTLAPDPIQRFHDTLHHVTKVALRGSHILQTLEIPEAGNGGMNSAQKAVDPGSTLARSLFIKYYVTYTMQQKLFINEKITSQYVNQIRKSLPFVNMEKNSSFCLVVLVD